MNGNVTAFDSQLLDKLTYISCLHTGKMTPDANLNRPLGSPRSLHKRQVDPVDTSSEAVKFGHKHSELVRLIL